MTPKEKKAQIELIKKAYSALDVLNNIGTSQYRERLYLLNKKDEIQHRRLKPKHIKKLGLTVDIAAKLICLRHIVDCMDGYRRLSMKDVINCRYAAVYAQSLVDNYKKEIKDSWAKADVGYVSIINLDYAELMK